MNKFLSILIISLTFQCNAFDDWDDDYYADEREIELRKPQRKDNIYVKGFYGHGYSTERYSHLDYITQEYDSSNKELGRHIEDYCDSIEEE